jgi:hypothetical protein
MPKILSLPEQLRGQIIPACFSCPYWDGSDPNTAHCNLIACFGIERPGPVEDGFEIGCPLEDAKSTEEQNA